MHFLTAINFFILILFNFTEIKADSCAFCNKKIIENESVLQGEYFNVLVSYAPLVKGHLLISPKRHIKKAHELSTEEWAELPILISKVVTVFSNFFDTDDYIILEKNGSRAFQTVPHVHFHLLPMTNQSPEGFFTMDTPLLSKEALKEEVALFRSYFSSLDLLHN